MYSRRRTTEMQLLRKSHKVSELTKLHVSPPSPGLRRRSLENKNFRHSRQQSRAFQGSAHSTDRPGLWAIADPGNANGWMHPACQLPLRTPSVSDQSPARSAHPGRKYALPSVTYRPNIDASCRRLPDLFERTESGDAVVRADCGIVAPFDRRLGPKWGLPCCRIWVPDAGSESRSQCSCRFSCRGNRRTSNDKTVPCLCCS